MKWLVLLALLLVGCDRRQASIELLAAETRRSQLIADIAQLDWLLRHTTRMERRIILEGTINEKRAELARLNGIILEPRPPL